MRPTAIVIAAMSVFMLTSCQNVSRQETGAKPATTATGATRAQTPAQRRAPAKLAIVTNNASIFWKVFYYGVHSYEAQSGATFEFKLPAQGRIQEQDRILEDLAAQHYDAVAVSVLSPDQQQDELKRLAAKTRLITFDADAPDCGRLMYIGVDNYKAGKTLGERIVRLLPNGGKMAMFVGSFAADNAAQRVRGIEEAIKGHHIEIIDRLEDQTDRAKARKQAEDVVAAHPDVNLLCGLWSYNGPAIADALKASGKNGKVLAVCFDEEDATLEAVADGTIQVTAVQSVVQLGHDTARWLDRLSSDFENARREIPKSGTIDIGVDLVDKSNLAEFRKRFDKARE